jgi:hypothetical protein
MSEAEGRFRERRSAHTTEEESSPAPLPDAANARGATDGPGRPDIVTGGDAPPPQVPPSEPVPPEPGSRRVPEAPFFDLVQYVVLRASQCLGEIPLDETGQQRVLPREAKEYIDLLSTLRELLGSDLSPDAGRAVDGVLTDLRTRYLEVT